VIVPGSVHGHGHGHGHGHAGARVDVRVHDGSGAGDRDRDGDRCDGYVHDRARLRAHDNGNGWLLQHASLRGDDHHNHDYDP